MKIYAWQPCKLINILVFGNSIDLDLDFRHFLSREYRSIFYSFPGDVDFEKFHVESKLILAAIKKQGEKESGSWNNKSTSFSSASVTRNLAQRSD